MKEILLSKHVFKECMTQADGVNTQTYLWLNRWRETYHELTHGRENLVKNVSCAMSTILT